MTAVRYTCAGNFGPLGITAFTPAPPRTTAVFSLKAAQRQIPVGQPGTQGVPAPRDGTADDRSASSIGGLSRTWLMPAAWYPSLYYSYQRIWDANFGGVRVFSDNLMPIPAIDPRRIPAGAQGPVAQPGKNTKPARPNRRLNGRQVVWPGRAWRWQGVNGG